MISRYVINSPIRLNNLYWDQLDAVAIAKDFDIFLNTHLLATQRRYSTLIFKGKHFRQIVSLDYCLYTEEIKGKLFSLISFFKSSFTIVEFLKGEKIQLNESDFGNTIVHLMQPFLLMQREETREKKYGCSWLSS